MHPLKISGMLSFGPEGVDLPMEQLNVLIGPNGSGKSNFIEALALLQAAPRDLSGPVRRMGGISQSGCGRATGRNGTGGRRCSGRLPEWRDAIAARMKNRVSGVNVSRSWEKPLKMNTPMPARFSNPTFTTILRE